MSDEAKTEPVKKELTPEEQALKARLDNRRAFVKRKLDELLAAYPELNSAAIVVASSAPRDFDYVYLASTPHERHPEELNPLYITTSMGVRLLAAAQAAMSDTAGWIDMQTQQAIKHRLAKQTAEQAPSPVQEQTPEEGGK